MAATFDESSAEHYKFVHGHRPHGYGMWVFSLDNEDGTSELVRHYGTYTSGKRWALLYANNSDFKTVRVLAHGTGGKDVRKV